MKGLLLNRTHLILFVVLAIASGLLVQFSGSREYMLGLFAAPIFLTALFQNRGVIAAKGIVGGQKRRHIRPVQSPPLDE